MADRDPIHEREVQRILELGALCDSFEAGWTGGKGELERILNRADLGDRPELFERLLEIDIERREEKGETPQPADYEPFCGEFEEIISRAFFPRIAGYRILRILGRGSMGVVYEAIQESLQRPVAIKTLASTVGLDRRRLQREARSVAKLRHPNIIQVYDVDIDAHPPYFTMERVCGGTLADRVELGPLPPREAMTIVRDLAQALAYVHGDGLHHLDIKPSNVLLEVDGNRVVPRLADFGIARAVDATLSWEAGHPIGTPSYMSPEQARGDAELDARADIYGLGALLYHLVSGQAPFEGTNPLALIQRVQVEDVPPLRKRMPSLDRDLETVCHRCLEKDPERRFSSALELASELEAILHGRPIVSRRPGMMRRLGDQVRRHPVASAFLATAFCAATAIGATLAWAKFKIEDADRAVHDAQADASDKTFEAEQSREVAEDAMIGMIRQVRELGQRLPPGTLTSYKDMIETQVSRMSALVDASDSGRQHFELGRTLTVVGDVYREQGKFTLAVDSYTEALERYELAESFDSAHEDAVPARIATTNNLSVILIQERRFTRAEEVLDQALSWLGNRQGSSDDHLGTESYLLHFNRAGLFARARKSEQAVASLRASLAHLERAEDVGARVGPQRGRVHAQLGHQQAALGLPRQALEEYRRARESISGSSPFDAPDLDLQSQVLLSGIDTGEAELRDVLGQGLESARLREAALERLDRLVMSYPGQFSLRQLLMNVHEGSARAAMRRSDFSTALRHLEASIDEARRFLQDDASSTHQCRVLSLRTKIAGVLIEIGSQDGGEQELEDVDLELETLAGSLSSTELHEIQVEVALTRGRLYAKTNSLEDAEDCVSEALELLEQAMEQEISVVAMESLRQALSQMCALRSRGAEGDALSWLRERRDLYMESSARRPEIGKIFERCLGPLFYAYFETGGHRMALEVSREFLELFPNEGRTLIAAAVHCAEAATQLEQRGAREDATLYLSAVREFLSRGPRDAEWFATRIVANPLLVRLGEREELKDVFEGLDPLD